MARGPEDPVVAPPGGPALESWLALVLSRSRIAVVVPVVVLVLSSLGAFAYGTDVFVSGLEEVVRHPTPVGSKIGLFLLLVDMFLIGATMLIAAVGFFELFLSRLEDVAAVRRMPAWLQMRDLNDLKARVVAMIVLVAAVSFVEAVVDVAPGLEILELGGGVAVVVVALTVFIRYGSPAHPEASRPPDSSCAGPPRPGPTRR